MRCFALFLGGLLLLAWRVSVMGGQAPSFSSSDNPAASSNSTLTRFLTFSHLPALNAILLLCPRALSFDWSMDAVPLVEGLGDARNTITLIFYAVLLALAYMAIVGNTGQYTLKDIMHLYTGQVKNYPVSVSMEQHCHSMIRRQHIYRHAQ